MNDRKAALVPSRLRGFHLANTIAPQDSVLKSILGRALLTFQKRVPTILCVLMAAVIPEGERPQPVAVVGDVLPTVPDEEPVGGLDQLLEAQVLEQHENLSPSTGSHWRAFLRLPLSYCRHPGKARTNDGEEFFMYLTYPIH